MKTYVVKYSGAVLIEASDEESAEEIAWLEHGIHNEDIESTAIESE